MKKFTLIEVFVAIAILLILLGMVVGAIRSRDAIKDIKEEGLKSSIETIWEGEKAQREVTPSDEVDASDSEVIKTQETP